MNTFSDKRIHIIGGPGSGKTTLARQVAACLQLPCYELDQVGYENGSGAERPLAVRLADIRQIAAQPGWVTEGVFLGWTSDLFESADRILWLDLPWRLAGWRIFIRHIRAELRGNNPHTGWVKLYHFMRWSRGYYLRTAAAQAPLPSQDIAENRATTAHYLAAFGPKVVHCQHPAAVSAYLANLTPGVSAQ